MKAAVMEDIGKIVVKDVPRPKIKAGELLLSVEACAVCGSDVRTIWHGSSHVKPPRILGHEVVGTILEVGEGVSGYEVGDLVAVAPAIGCGKCMYCRSGHTNMCPELETIGFEFDGGFAEIMVVPAKAILQGHVNKLPAGLLPEQAVIAEPLACCLNGQELLGISLGQRVAVIGAGIIGLFHAELALLKGASQIFVVDVVAKRLEYARALGERVVVINSMDTNPVTEILSRTDGYGVEVVVVACPVGEAQAQALEMVARRGRVSLFGGLPPKNSLGYLDSNVIHYKEIGVFGAHASTAAQNRFALNLLAHGQINLHHYSTHVFPLSQIMEGIEAMREGKIMKAIIKP